MADFDVAVIGGGPAGYAAALKAAARGATTVLVEAERPGGACVHHACIPTSILLDAAAGFVEARELAIHGVFAAGEEFNFARAAARKDALVKRMADGIAAALRMRQVTVIAGRAQLTSSTTLAISAADGPLALSAESIIIATGTRWEPPAIPGLSSERLLTADVVQSLRAAPRSALVLGGGPSGGAFGLEYAALLAIAGTEVTFAEPGPQLLPGLDRDVANAATGLLAGFGIKFFDGASAEAAGPAAVAVAHSAGTKTVPAEIVVVADARRPFSESLGAEHAGIVTGGDGAIAVDRSCRTSAATVYAVGDVTGGLMLSSAATHMGEVAALNATGAEAVVRLRAIPHVLHTLPGIAWVGLTEAQARAKGHDAATGTFDLSYNARAITLGAREGLLKVIAARDTGELLGVHAAGPDASEIVAVAAALMQAEVTAHDLAAQVHWHPSVSEGLVEAARRALA